ncbi:LOB domain-containing protein 7-like [Primulina huaijiensis]|uniref:LOB domain-containing protein 7-like n=1 Tax=Primulina huaijiensis TaxID=1492673 RepID=UPI003CC725FE
MTLRDGGSTPSCAACRYRRRKCTAACPLAKYFPAHKPELFHYVHRLYGVSNVTKILNTLETQDQKDDAMKSIIFESEWRHHIPAYGCSFIILQVSSQLEAAEEELRRIRIINAVIAANKDQSNQQVDHNPYYWPSSQQEFGGNRPRIDSQDVEGTESVPFQIFLNKNVGIYAESPENVAGQVLGLDLLSDVTSNHNLLSTHLEAQTGVHGIQREPEIFFPDYGGLLYSTTADDRQSYIENKEACGPSSKSSPINDQLGE